MIYLRPRLVACIAALILLAAPCSQGASPWLSAPQPKYPAGALQQDAEGPVTLRIFLQQDGSVKDVRVVKSSGSQELDNAAAKALSKWRLQPAAVTPSDMKEGRLQVVEFRQEPIVAAVYRDRIAGFKSTKSPVLRWFMSTPFAEYPESARRRRAEGRAVVSITIGPDGRPARVTLLKSCGHDDLDQAAVESVWRWRAHKEFAGQKTTVPITFDLRQ